MAGDVPNIRFYNAYCQDCWPAGLELKKMEELVDDTEDGSIESSASTEG